MNYPTSDLGFAAVLHAIKYPRGPIDTKDITHIVFTFVVPEDQYEKVIK